MQDLREDDLARLVTARKVVADLIRTQQGETAASSIDLSVLQKLLDTGAIASDEIFKLQCIGIVFGDLLCARSRFEWGVIDDEYGRDPTLTYPGKALNLNALTLVSKRVANGDEVDLASIAEWALERAEAVDAADIH